MLNYDYIKIEENGKDEFLKEIKNLSLEKVEKFKKDFFDSICDDIEYFMDERLENLKRMYVSTTVDYLLGKEYIAIEENQKTFIEKFIGSLGYDSMSFRKKIFKENKEEILKDITADFIYENLEKSFVRYFGSWKYEDLKISYPQTDIIKAFAIFFIKNIDNSNLIIKEELKKEILELNDELQYLKNKIKELNKILEKELS